MLWSIAKYFEDVGFLLNRYDWNASKIFLKSILPDKAGDKATVGGGEELDQFVVNQGRLLLDVLPALLQGDVDVGPKLGLDLPQDAAIVERGRHQVPQFRVFLCHRGHFVNFWKNRYYLADFLKRVPLHSLVTR